MISTIKKNSIITFGLSKEETVILNETIDLSVYHIVETEDSLTDLLAIPANYIIMNPEKLNLEELSQIVDCFSEDHTTEVIFTKSPLTKTHSFSYTVMNINTSLGKRKLLNLFMPAHFASYIESRAEDRYGCRTDPSFLRLQEELQLIESNKGYGNHYLIADKISKALDLAGVRYLVQGEVLSLQISHVLGFSVVNSLEDKIIPEMALGAEGNRMPRICFNLSDWQEISFVSEKNDYGPVYNKAEGLEDADHMPKTKEDLFVYLIEKYNISKEEAYILAKKISVGIFNTDYDRTKIYVQKYNLKESDIIYFKKIMYLPNKGEAIQKGWYNNGTSI